MYDGEVTSTYKEAATTLGEWARMEPGNSSGIRITSSAESGPIYALFVTGSFFTYSPVVMLPDGSHDADIPTRLTSGRILVDGSGQVLSVELWTEKKSADPAFGADLDEN